VPGLCPASGQAGHERGGNDLLHVPAFSERIAKLLLRHAARAHVPRLAIAEAEQVQHAAGLQHGGQAGDVHRPLAIFEDVEHAAIERRVEPPAERTEREDVGNEELDWQFALDGLGPCLLDRSRRCVDADDRRSAGGQFERVLSGAATEVDDGALEPAGFGDLDDFGLRPPDVPRRDADVHLVEPSVVGHVRHPDHLAIPPRLALDLPPP
jgi:hypothetical protein